MGRHYAPGRLWHKQDADAEDHRPDEPDAHYGAPGARPWYVSRPDCDAVCTDQ